MCVGVEYLTFDILLIAKSNQKGIGNQFCSSIILKNSLKTGFSLRNIGTYCNLCRVSLDCNKYFLFVKQALNEFKGYWYIKKNRVFAMLYG